MPTVMNGVSLNALTTVDSWSALSLFANGEQGVWYDPSDISTMFQDSAGTTPAVLEQPVGLILDKSKNLALGPELITNGTFDTNTIGWSADTAATLSSVNGRLRVTNSSAGNGEAYIGFSTTIGKWYRFAVSCYPGTTNTDWYISDSAPSSLTGSHKYLQNASGDYTAYFLASATTTYIRLELRSQNTGLYGEFDNVSVREIAGNHASQPTSTSRPVLSARYNLFTYTEQFTNAVWNNNSAITVSENTTQAPDGKNTAATFTANTSTVVHNRGRQITLSSNTQYTISIHYKAGTNNFATINANGNGSTDWAAIIANVSTGVITKTQVNGGFTIHSSNITDLSNGWFRLTATVSTTSSFGYIWFAMTSTGTPTLGSYGMESWTALGTETVYVWGADVRPTNIGVGLPAYQRVGAATYGVTNPSVVGGTPDYDAMNFPPYLKFDGVDDFLVSSTINFTSSDKMSVFAGVRKLTDSISYGVIVELSTGTQPGNPGSFGLFSTSFASTPAYHTGSFVTQTSSLDMGTYAAPSTNIISVLFDNSQNTRALSIIPRVNGVTPIISSGLDVPAGAGNFGNYALYLGMRAGATLRYNGNLYGLLVRGALSNSTQIENAENYINSKTKAY